MPKWCPFRDRGRFLCERAIERRRSIHVGGLCSIPDYTCDRQSPPPCCTLPAIPHSVQLAKVGEVGRRNLERSISLCFRLVARMYAASSSTGAEAMVAQILRLRSADLGSLAMVVT